MAKIQNDAMLNAALQWVKDNTTQIYIVNGSGATNWSTLQANALGKTSFTISASISSGSGSGRALVVSAASSIGITGSGTMAHVALAKDASSIWAYTTTIPSGSQASIGSGDTVNTSAWTIKVNDAA